MAGPALALLLLAGCPWLSGSRSAPPAPSLYSASLLCGKDQVSRQPCSADRAKTLKPLVLFPEHHLGFEAGLWVGYVKCQY